MKKNRIVSFFIIVSLFFFLNDTFAQLSDRVNNPTTFKTGTRPIAGNMGLLVGVNIDDLEESFSPSDEGTLYKRLPLIYLKYFYQDDLAFRLGVYSYRKSTVRKGDLDPLLNGGIVYADFTERTFEMLLNPGAEKHFGTSNILDVYVGAAVPLGVVREVNNNTENTSAIKNINETSRLSYIVGISGFVGVRAFIADLPMAIGIEFGYQGRTYLSNKVKHEVTVGTQKQTYYTVDDDDTGAQYGLFESLKSRNSDGKTTISISLNYYFNK